MGKVIKWTAICVGALIIVVVAALLVIPMFVDTRSFLPDIEERVSEAAGRPFEINGDFKLSLFPNTGFYFSDLRIGNAKGFQENDFVSIKSFDVRLKLFPLIFRDIQIKRFIIESPRIALEKNKDGRGNWEGLFDSGDEDSPGAKKKGNSSDVKKKGNSPEAKEKKEEAAAKEKKEEPGVDDSNPDSDLPINNLVVGDFSINNGTVLWINHASGESREVKDLAVKLKDVSLDRAIEFTLSALYNDHPVSIEGRFGPVGEKPGEGTLPLDMSLKFSDSFKAGVKGRIDEPGSKLAFDLSLDVVPFSPRKLFKDLNEDFPVETADAKALDKLSFKVHITGDSESVSIKNGSLTVDESRLVFSGRAKDFSKPDVVFDLNLDRIDLDRYLPPPPPPP